MPSMLERFIARIARPMTPAEEGYAQALECIDKQMATIAKLLDHIKSLDARIDKLEQEARGLRELL